MTKQELITWLKNNDKIQADFDEVNCNNFTKINDPEFKISVYIENVIITNLYSLIEYPIEDCEIIRDNIYYLRPQVIISKE